MDRDEAHLLDMLIWARRAIAYSDGIGEEQFLANTLRQDAVIRCLQVVGDGASRVSEQFKNAHCEIDWFQIRGMRNRLVHEYGDVDLRVVYSAATVDCARLVERVEPLVPSRPDDPDARELL